MSEEEFEPTIATTSKPSDTGLTGNLDLADPDVIQRLTDIYKNATKECMKEATKEPMNKIEELEITAVKQDIRLETVEMKVNNIEQREKNKNVIIRGVPTGQHVLKKSLELLNNELKFTLQRSDIKYAVRIGKEGG